MHDLRDLRDFEVNFGGIFLSRSIRETLDLSQEDPRSMYRCGCCIQPERDPAGLDKSDTLRHRVLVRFAFGYWTVHCVC